MTFSARVKNELCKASRPFDAASFCLLYGMLLFSRNFKLSEISFHTENGNISELVYELLMQNFDCAVDVEFSGTDKKENIILRVSEECDRKAILTRFGHLKKDEINLRINKDLLKTQEDVKSFLKGAFIVCGTVTDPQNGYHLEFCVPYMNLSKCLFEVLTSLKNVPLKVKSTTRKGVFVVYIKDSSDITDFLTYVGAPLCAMDFMQIKMVKEVRNYVNRTTNFEAANISKTAVAATAQIDAIKKMKKAGKFNCLDDDLRELANLRLKNPEMSLRELGKNLSTPLTRSGVNHKMKKLLSMSENM